MSEERLVPKLRFVEFKDGWKSKTLGEISEIYGRIGFRGYTVKDLVSEGEGALTLGGKHINSNNRLDLSEPDYLSWDKYEEIFSNIINVRNLADRFKKLYTKSEKKKDLLVEY